MGPEKAVKFLFNGQGPSIKADELGWAKEATTFSIAGAEPSNRNF